MSARMAAASLVLLLPYAAGCATAMPRDYSAYLDHMPRSILVLPPLNESPEAGASYPYLSTVTRSLAQRGYYVFPVAMVDACLKENGLPTPAEMHAVPPHRLGEVFGADAVLYLTLREWGNQYRVIDSAAVVAVRGRLVDCATGTVLWEHEATAEVSSSQGSDNPFAMVVVAVFSQVLSSADGRSLDASRKVNDALALRLLPGPRDPRHAEEVARRREARAKREAEAGR